MSCSDTNTSLGGSYCSTTRGSGSSTNFGNSSSSQGVVTVSPGVGSGGNTTVGGLQASNMSSYFSCCGARSSSSGSGSGTGSTSNTGSGSGSGSGTGGNTGGTTGTTGGGYGSGSSTTTVQNPSPSTTAVSSGTDRS
ncbi:uncharacterized protein B0T23DRAFT_446055 [Neurospora hispaniola]|uniref:Uncharacterized protein n=1 Tax=Neurospora hispaniola TaxID=588809 RepID=A0AAJ0I4R7_9PEZI|nr:hypothetical protein B0T23DRAFT_446055 [Neurospora hispaniola]